MTFLFLVGSTKQILRNHYLYAMQSGHTWWIKRASIRKLSLRLYVVRFSRVSWEGLSLYRYWFNLVVLGEGGVKQTYLLRSVLRNKTYDKWLSKPKSLFSNHVMSIGIPGRPWRKWQKGFAVIVVIDIEIKQQRFRLNKLTHPNQAGNILSSISFSVHFPYPKSSCKHFQ